MPAAALIANRIHFVWFGRQLPCFAAIAAKSAQAHNRDAKVVLWHDGTLQATSRTRAVERAGVELRALALGDLLASAQALTQDPELRAALATVGELATSLASVTARSNLIRLLILWVEGGIYLDTDTLTLKSLQPLRGSAAFCGREHLLWSKRRLDKRKAYFWTLGPLLTASRLFNARVRSAYSLQRALLRFYDQAANNAVLGFSQQHAFLQRALTRIAQLPQREQAKRFRLGTHLLQELLAAEPGDRERVEQLPPEYFYPLGPVTSMHYFHQRRDPAATAQRLVPTGSYVLHWYASVRDLAPLDEAHIQSQRHRNVFAHLCAPFVE